MQIYTGKKDTKFRICNPVRELLLQNEDVKAIVGNRIYPIIAPEGTKGSFITYARSEYTIKKTSMMAYEHDCTILLCCVSHSYDESQKLAEAVYLALEGLYQYRDESGLVINGIALEDSYEDAVEDVFVQMLRLKIW
jgi:hypothetical protein